MNKRAQEISRNIILFLDAFVSILIIFMGSVLFKTSFGMKALIFSFAIILLTVILRILNKL